MQQKLCPRSFLLLEKSSPASDSASACELPFRCPRCGEQERFRSLSSLRTHLELCHSYRSPDLTSSGFSITGKPPDSLTTAIPWQELSLPARRGQQQHPRPPHVRSLSDSRDSGYFQSCSSARRRTQSVGVGTQEEDEDGDGREEEDDEEDEEEEEGSKTHARKSESCQYVNHQVSPPDEELELLDQSPFSGLHLRRRLLRMLRAADSTMQRRLSRLSTELAQADTELLCERAHSQYLAQERQEVAERQRSLSRQVDVAVMVIAALKEQLNASESELERREREVLTIQRFLDTAVRQETSGKVRIQQFIENLLTRIALTERLVEYYQVNGSPPRCQHHHQQRQAAESSARRITKSRSAGAQLFSRGVADRWSRSFSQLDPGPAPACRDLDLDSDPDQERERERERRERLARSSRLFCRPEHRDDIWNQQRRRSAGHES